MPASPTPERTSATQCKSADELAFSHYLRTGERLTAAEWCARYERKFNPYHDRLGRFTFAAGAVAPTGGTARMHPGSRARGAGARTPAPAAAKPAPDAAQPAAPTAASAGSGFRSDLVRGAVSQQPSTADTYFELNKRQAALDKLRAQAGPNPDAQTSADLADFQNRLDENRKLLDSRYRFADQQTTEILRAGMEPADVAIGAGKIATGQGELRDYLSLASVLPVGGVVGKLGKLGKVAGAATHAAETVDVVASKVEQLGGAYRDVRKLRGYHAHHLVADSVSNLSKGEGPSIAMTAADHMKTLSWGHKPGAEPYRQMQAELVKAGKFHEALQLEVKKIREIFGSKYDDALEQALNYSRARGH